MRNVDWFKVSLVLIVITLLTFPELAMTTRDFVFLSYSWLAATIGMIYYRVGEILLTHFFSVLILLSTAVIIFLFVLIRIPVRSKSDVGRYDLQRRVGKGWKTVREFDHHVEETIVQGYPPGTYKLMQIGKDGRFQHMVWLVRGQGRERPRISLRYLHAIAEREEDERRE